MFLLPPFRPSCSAMFGLTTRQAFGDTVVLTARDG
jgi:hypothetical protein